MLKNKLKSLNANFLPGKLFYAPTWIVLGVNNICNLHCKMCDVGVNYNQSNFYTNLMGSKPINMPPELITKIIKSISTHFPQTKLGLGFTEPLIYPHLEHTLSLANKHKVYTSITTNALTLKSKAEIILNNKLQEINISLDGPEEIHNQIRGHKSSFQRAIEGIETLLKHPNPPKIGVYCVITEWNIGHLQSFYDYFKNYPINKIGFMHTNFTTDEMAQDHNQSFSATYPATASNMDAIDIDKMDLDMLWDEIKLLSQKNEIPISFSPNIISKSALFSYYHESAKPMGKRCNDVFENIMIKSNGDVIPAHGRCYNLTIGNLYNNPLDDIWNSTTIGNFRKTLNKNGGLLPACNRCCSAFGQ